METVHGCLSMLDTQGRAISFNEFCALAQLVFFP